MKILHTADWHIGQFKGPVVDGVNLRSQDTVKCLEYMVQVAIEEKPDIVCVSGDIFHQNRLAREVFRRNDYGNEHHYIISTFFEVCDRDARHSKSRWSCSV